ncbi:MAG: RNA polymerase sigma-70 factor [Flavobacterium sp.]|nr:MAG: RNA polymerase sigma-70 factor [Flavobacterium sp.]
MTNYSSYADFELVNLLKTGDRIALNEIYKRYQGILYSHAYRRLPSREDVRDIIQDLFFYLWTHREQLEFRVSLSSYLYASVRNRVLNQARNQKVRENFATSLQKFIDLGENLVEESLQEKELASLIEKEVLSLPKQMRVIFEMSRSLDMSHQEIAEKLDLSTNTVRNQVHNALKILRTKLGNKDLLTLF